MSEIVPVQEQVKTVAKYLNAPGFLQQIKAALPKAGVTAERMARLVLTEVRRNPTLAECRIESLLGAAMQCAQYGLEPGPAGHAWIIPRKNKGVMEANFQLGYKGLCQLLWRSGNVSWINAQVVHERDTFDYSLGAPPGVTFKPAAGDDRGAITHVFAAIGTTSGGTLLEVWTFDQVEEHRSKHVRSSRSSPWDSDWGPMAKKTVLIQAAKFAPLSIEAHRAIDLDEKSDRGIPQEIDVTPAVESPPPAPEPEAVEAETVPDDEDAQCAECGFDLPVHHEECDAGKADQAMMDL